MIFASPTRTAEWNQFGSGPWNWDENRANLTKFWTDGVKRALPYESVYTIGMRGTGDCVYSLPRHILIQLTTKPVPLDESGNIDLLERIVAGQRDILSGVYNKNASEIPQMWCLYKEVQGYYVRSTCRDLR